MFEFEDEELATDLLMSEAERATVPLVTGDPSCPICQGYGFVVPNLRVGEPGFGRVIPCQCRQQLLAVQENKIGGLDGRLSEYTFTTFECQRLMLPKQMWQKLEQAYSYSLAFAEYPSNRWLVLRGSYGSGKTHLAAAIANHRRERNLPVTFVNVPDLLDALRSSYRSDSGLSFDERFDRLRNSPLLILDDFGAHNASDWAQEKIYQLINHRYNYQLPMAVTMNGKLEQVDGRIRSRLTDAEISQIIEINVPDFRMDGREEYDELSSLELHDSHSFSTFYDRSSELQKDKSKLLKTVAGIMVNFAQAPAGWIVLSSAIPYNGKTHLAAATAYAAKQAGHSVLFVGVADLLDHLRATFDPKTGATLDSRFQQIKDVSLLFLDDLGMESATPWAREKVQQLFNHRYLLELPTVITTSLPIQEIEPTLRARFIDPQICRFISLEKIPSYTGKKSGKAVVNDPPYP